jgi:hypothetical protein
VRLGTLHRPVHVLLPRFGTASIFLPHPHAPVLWERPLPIDQASLDNWFVYHKPEGDQPERYEKLRAAGKVFAEAIVALTPPSADQSAAIRLVREAVFTANAAIACGGR